MTVLIGRAIRIGAAAVRKEVTPRPGLAANLYRRTATAKDARRFLGFEDLVLRFQSYLSTAAKWGISTLDALRDLFTGHAWLPPGIEPSG